MTIFVFLNWVYCIGTSFFLIILLRWYRYLFIKPSILVICFFHIQIQWAATIYSNFIETYLLFPWSFALLVHGFPLIGLFITSATARNNTMIVWNRITNFSYSSNINKRSIFILLVFVLLINIFYLSYIPFSKTGLYTIFTDPLHSAQAREESLKLIDNILLRYSYSFLRSSFVPLLAVLLTILLIQSFKRKQIVWGCFAIITLGYILFVVGLPGNRISIALIILTIIMALFIKKKMPIRPLYIILVCVLVLLIPSLLSLFREGKEVNIHLLFQYLITSIFQRAFVTPMETGLWHVHYAQTVGFFGIAGIPKLAVLFGIKPINSANIIYLNYHSISLLSGFANTCYLFSYYSYFGIISFVFSLVGLWLLDFAILVYRQISDRLLLPCVASVSVASMSFVSSDYLTVISTHGFGVILILAWLLDRSVLLKCSLIPSKKLIRGDL